VDIRTIICCGSQPGGAPNSQCDWALVDSREAAPIGCPQCGSDEFLVIAGPGVTSPAAGPVPFMETTHVPAGVMHPLVVARDEDAEIARG